MRIGAADFVDHDARSDDADADLELRGLDRASGFGSASRDGDDFVYLPCRREPEQEDAGEREIRDVLLRWVRAAFNGDGFDFNLQRGDVLTMKVEERGWAAVEN